MPLRGNGQLLAKVRGLPFSALIGDNPRFEIPGYSAQPLSDVLQSRPDFDASKPADHWLLLAPAARARAAGDVPQPTDLTPWDTAHAAAKAIGYAHYIEPDILHERIPPSPHQPNLTQRNERMLRGEVRAAGGQATQSPRVLTLQDNLNSSWPPLPTDPKDPSSVDISPGWHLLSAYTGFSDVRAMASGRGVKIAHLDTGYTPAHPSTPRGMQPNLARDFWSPNQDDGAVDPGEDPLGPLDMPGHGTATLALLAGNSLDLTYLKPENHFQGDFGGAPDAMIVPVRIGPSVIHLYSSSMAKGMFYALAPGNDPANCCDVVSISHGGLPSQLWADAVNQLYYAGVTIVASSGDSIYLGLFDLATHYTVYPSAFNHVITAVGVTFTKQPYVTADLTVMQGCWGPDNVMDKAIAAYAPNVAWMEYKQPDPVGDPTRWNFSMDGNGTSSSTPQIAAACALWLELYAIKGKLPKDWHRVEACRLALFDGADNKHPNKSKLGWGLLRVPEMLDLVLAAKVIDQVMSPTYKPLPDDSVSVFTVWLQILLGLEPPNSEQDRMYETEVVQVILQSTNPEFVKAAQNAPKKLTYSRAEQTRFRVMLSGESISQALRSKLNSLGR